MKRCTTCGGPNLNHNFNPPIDSIHPTCTRCVVAAYRKRMANHVHTEEELFEMRAAFGPGARVVNVITGQSITLDNDEVETY